TSLERRVAHFRTRITTHHHKPKKKHAGARAGTDLKLSLCTHRKETLPHPEG
ncbi:unnamed protein product, partial [Amoebophrya sp. A25]